MQQYHTLFREILGRGDVQFEPRTEEYILGISAWHSTYDLRKGFPLTTTKKVPPRLPFEEVFWKLRGERNVKSLVDRKIHFWSANAFDRHLKNSGLNAAFPKHTPAWNSEFAKYKQKLEDDPTFAATAGDLGPVYGYQWRHGFEREGREFDQLVSLLQDIKKRPGSRYHILNAWNPSDLPDMALGPCPFWHQFTIYGSMMDLTMVQRSCDVFLGAPFNLAQDSLLLHMVARETGYTPRFFNHTPLNAHAYLGVQPRSNFWINADNVTEFQRRFSAIGADDRNSYLELRAWYLGEAGPESEGNERKDHVPFMLEQLSKEPGSLPTIHFLNDVPLLEAIQRPTDELVSVTNYNPAIWDSKATMAA